MTYIQRIIAGCNTPAEKLEALEKRLAVVDGKIKRALIEDSEGHHVSDEYLNRLDGCYVAIKEAIEVIKGN